METSQMHLSQKQKIFSELFAAFLEFALNFEHFQKKMTLIAYVFLKLRTTKDVLREMPKNSRLRGPLDMRHGKRVEILLQSYRRENSLVVFLIHSLPMTSIPLLVETIECKQFRCIYLKNKRFFLNFVLRFSNVH